jgi:hypothetical protein
MKTREDTIAFARNYCQHYDPQPRGKGCKAGMPIDKIQTVKTGEKGLKWGPCIEGHLLPDVLTICPKWLRVTQEAAEKRADDIEESIQRMTKVGPVVAAWRKREPIGKQEVIACPVCGGRLHLSQAAYNGHVWGRCETKDCVAWME